MRSRGWSIRIQDILQAVRKIKSYTDNMSAEEFAEDSKTVDAVVRNFTVLGEAAARVPAAIRKRFPAVPWAQMIGMRNIVVHEYFGISLGIVWATARNRLPELETAILAALEMLTAPTKRTTAAVKKPKKPRKSKN